ncbi:MAG TPA: NAD(P)-dependent oxidoreductase [Methylomirabilota bacterium]|nr:NAD(P)-dependent oxidoreductase [Methylomirabilota bacterium]
MGATVACVGLGLLGSALAENLIRAGFTVRGHDIAPERVREHAARGGVAAASPADAARGAGVVVTCLMTAEIVREVLLGRDGALETAGPDPVVIDCSTVHPDASAALAADLARRGVPMLDAPVAGGSAQARRREAPVLVGGERAVFDRCRPVLDALTARARHVGPSGSGARAKLVVNLVLGLNRLALAEGLLFGRRQGLDGQELLAVLKDSAAYSKAMDVKGERMLTDRFEPEGKLAQHLKDVELMLEVGHAAGAPLLATALHRQLLTAGVARGWGERDNAAIIAVLRSLVTDAP